MTMDRSSRADRVLVGLFDELADARTPDYLEAAIERASSRPQRPAWTLPERWFPMAETVSRPAFAPRVPWRAIGVALAILALLIAGAVFVGSHQHRPAPPFGVAANGLIAYANGGDIYTVDPVSGVAKAIVSGPEIDASPVFSLDGTKIDFLRRHDVGAQTAFDLVVANADGSDQHVLATGPLDLDPFRSWSADSRSVIVATSGGVTQYDVLGSAAPNVLPAGRYVPGEIRPPDGAQLLYEPDSTPEVDLWIMNIDGTGARPLIPATALKGMDSDLDEIRWSPDGSVVAFTCTPPDGSEGTRICLVNADGSSLHALTDESGAWTETDLRWSPDGRSIAFDRWQKDSTSGAWLIQPIGMADIAGGPVREMGPTPDSAGASFDFAPDGKTLLSIPAYLSGSGDPNAAPARPLAIDTATGIAHEMTWGVNSDVSWQRTAP
jgi:WD40-like Beta Propeller Repeat